MPVTRTMADSLVQYPRKGAAAY